MRRLTAADIVDAWEQAQGCSHVQRALRMLATACPDEAPATLRSLSVGRRDAELMELHRLSFGEDARCRTICPACEDVVEFSVHLSALIGRDDGARSSPELAVEMSGRRIRLRLPTSEDLEAVLAGDDGADRRRALLARCLIDTDEEGAALSLPAEVERVVLEHLAAADPHADVRLEIECPMCSHAWSCGFDIVSIIWSQVAARARRLVREVHSLASAYGWREADILAMGAPRRQAYLELAGR